MTDSQRASERTREAGAAEAAVGVPVQRPWGQFRTVHRGPGFQVKHLRVDAGQTLSLQRHRHRSEHWVVVRGMADVTRGHAVFRLLPDQGTTIPLGALHRLSNPGPGPLDVIEVQFGTYLGEDDIERVSDVYGRRAPTE